MSISSGIGEATARAMMAFARRPTAAQSTRRAVARAAGDRWRTEVQVGTHTLVVDQSDPLGGDDAGPNPGDLIRAALAACLVQCYVLHAPRFGITLDGVDVVVETEIDLRTAFGVALDPNPGFSAVRYTVTLRADAAEARLQELRRFVERTNPTLDDLRRALHVRGELIVTPAAALQLAE